MTYELKIEGMTCDHCVRTVSDILSEVVGVENVDVNLKSKSAKVKGTPSRSELIDVINATPAFKAS